MPCPSHSCQYLMAVSITLLALSWILWFPFAFWERRMPLTLAWIALLSTCGAVIVVGLFMPYACKPCGGLP